MVKGGCEMNGGSHFPGGNKGIQGPQGAPRLVCVCVRLPVAESINTTKGVGPPVVSNSNDMSTE